MTAPKPISVRTGSAPRFQTYPIFDGRARWLYGLLAAAIVAELALLFALGMSLDSTPILLAQFWPPLIIAAWGSRRLGWDRFAIALEANALLYGQGLALCFSTALLATISGPLADDLLSRADEWLGFSWVAYYELTRPYLGLLKEAYYSFRWLPAVVICGLAIEHRYERVWQFVAGGSISLIISVLMFPLLPAATPIIVHQISDPELSSAANFYPVMMELRGGLVQTIDVQHIAGMVSFPSYHTVAAVLLAWAAWPSKWMRWPVTLICIAMALAIPTHGDHYLIDMIGGSLLALAVIPLSVRLVQMPSSPVATVEVGS